jgi:hypothetical protein
LFISTRHPLPIGTPVVLEFTLPKSSTPRSLIGNRAEGARARQTRRDRSACG